MDRMQEKTAVENKRGERAIDRKIVVFKCCTYKAGCCEPNGPQVCSLSASMMGSPRAA